MPFKERVKYKSAIFVYKGLNNLAPDYIGKMFKYVSDVSSRSTRASQSNKLYIDPSLKKGCVRNSVCYAGATIWNNLDSDVRSAPNLNCFKTRYLNAYFSEAST